MSPSRLTPSERKIPPISASNHVILLLIYARRQKFRIFLRVGGAGSKQGDFRDLGVGVLLSVGYSLDRTLHLQIFSAPVRFRGHFEEISIARFC